MINSDMFSQAAKCSRTIVFLMQVFGDPTYEQRFHKSSRDDAFESVRSILSLPVASELMPIPQIMNSWDSETRVAIESGWVNFVSHAVEVYNKFGRRLRINLRW